MRAVVTEMEAESAKPSGKSNQLPDMPSDYIEAQLAPDSGSAPKYTITPLQASSLPIVVNVLTI